MINGVPLLDGQPRACDEYKGFEYAALPVLGEFAATLLQAHQGGGGGRRRRRDGRLLTIAVRSTVPAATVITEKMCRSGAVAFWEGDIPWWV